MATTEKVQTTPVSNTVEEEVVEEVAAPEPIVKISHIPLFWGESKEQMEEIEASGVKTYYIVGEEKRVIDKVTVKSPVIYRVDKSILGRAIMPADTKDLQLLTSVSPGATYDLPLMPYEFVCKLNAFFRLAYKLYQSEAVLILTFDPSMLETENPSDGWGCITPKQENTSVACKYEMDEVMKLKPVNVKIVGSIHSHPAMTAYFSGTDHKDQAEWTGLHITMAWKSGSMVTDSYIEMIAGGEQWTLDIENVYAPAPAPDVDTSEVEEWVKSVSKKVTPPATTPTRTGSMVIGGTGGTASIQTRNPNWQSPYQGGRSGGGTQTNKPRAFRLPVGAPNPTTTMIIAASNFEDSNGQCPLCKMYLSHIQWDSGRCISCEGFIIAPETTIDELVAQRTERHQIYCIGIDPTKAPKPIVIWTPKGTNGSTDDEWSPDMRDSEILAALGADSPKE